VAPVTNPRNDAIEESVINRIAGRVGGTPRRVDDGSADRLHDHEIVRADGRVIAIEITGEVDDAVGATASATRKNRLTDSGVTGVWDVSLADSNANRRQLVRRLPAVLMEYENGGRRRVTGDDDSRLPALGIADSRSTMARATASTSPASARTRSARSTCSTPSATAEPAPTTWAS
jgi:hypothetical protein